MVIQGVYFVLLGRHLGAHGYGLFAGAVAFVFILAPFAGLGSSNVLIMNVARNPAVFPVYWGKCLLTLGVSGTFFTLITWRVGSIFLPNVPMTLLVSLAIAEFFFGRAAEASGQAFQAFERLKTTAQINVFLGMARLAGVLGFSVSSSRTPEMWGLWYLGSTAFVGFISILWVSRVLGLPRITVPTRLDFRLGFHFALGLASSTMYADIDKTMLTRMGTPEAAGVYAAAYRAIVMALSPISSLFRATYARFFRQGVEGLRGCLDLAFRLMPFTVLYGLASFLLLFFLAPWAPLIMGQDFQAAVGALRLLAPLPLIDGIYYLGGNVLTGAGYVKVRSYLQLLVAILNVVLNLYLIPRWSWMGAGWASLVTDGALALSVWTAIAFLIVRSKSSGKEEANRESSSLRSNISSPWPSA